MTDTMPKCLKLSEGCLLHRPCCLHRAQLSLTIIEAATASIMEPKSPELRTGENSHADDLGNWLIPMDLNVPSNRLEQTHQAAVRGACSGARNRR